MLNAVCSIACVAMEWTWAFRTFVKPSCFPILDKNPAAGTKLICLALSWNWKQKAIDTEGKKETDTTDWHWLNLITSKFKGESSKIRRKGLRSLPLWYQKVCGHAALVGTVYCAASTGHYHETWSSLGPAVYLLESHSWSMIQYHQRDSCMGTNE